MSHKVHVHNTGLQTISMPGDSRHHTALKPGMNVLEAAEWEEAKKNQTIAHHIKVKTLVEKSATPAEKKEEKAADKAAAVDAKK